MDVGINNSYAIIPIDRRVYNNCLKFAQKRIEGSSSMYRRRGEHRVDKMENDIMVGAIGEWAVFKYLESMGYAVSEPDMNIYEVRGKSFDADLICEDKVVHVKSQSMASVKRYGSSWLLQKTDPLVSSPAENDYFALTNVDLETMEVELLGIIRCDKVDYGECRVPRYRHSKVALYFEQLDGRKLWHPKQK